MTESENLGEKAARFGDSFEIKPENRLDILDSNIEIPDYVETGRQVRALLLEASGESDEWKEMPPEINGVEDIFEKAKMLVTQEWGKKVTPFLAEKCKGWAQQLEGLPQYAKAKELLEDSEALEIGLMIRQFGLLESLRGVLPNAWRELVMISSERQLASVAVARRWVFGLPPDRTPALLEKCGLKSKTELEIFVDSAALLGKYIDQAYVKQIELADAPGGSVKTPKGEESSGVKYLYDVYKSPESDEVDMKPYVDVFPFEWSQLAKRLHLLADKVDVAFKTQDIGSEYKNFGKYLRDMANVYSSTVVDPELLLEQWNQLLRDMKDLVFEGCPIMLVPQASPTVAADANKVDAEIRLCFITKESKELLETMNYFRSVVDGILVKQRPHFASDHVAPPVIMNYQPFAFGPNVYWTTRGEEGTEKIVAHTNSTVDVAVMTALPTFESMFDEKIDEGVFARATILECTLHELGHQIAPKEDEDVRKRIGVSNEMFVVEELKADTGQMKILWETIQAGRTDLINVRDQLIASLADVCDYLKNKSSEISNSGERYYSDGMEIIYTLLQKGIIVESGDKYIITDALAGIKAMADLGDNLLENQYLSGTPEQLQAYVQEIRERKNDPKVAKFLDRLTKN